MLEVNPLKLQRSLSQILQSSMYQQLLRSSCSVPKGKFWLKDLLLHAEPSFFVSLCDKIFSRIQRFTEIRQALAINAALMVLNLQLLCCQLCLLWPMPPQLLLHTVEISVKMLVEVIIRMNLQGKNASRSKILILF